MSPTMEALWPPQSDASSPNRDTAEVVYSPRRAAVFRRSLSVKKTGFSAEKADAKLHNGDAELSQALPSPSSLPRPTFWSSLIAKITAFLRWKKSMQHILSCMLVTIVLIVVAIKSLCVGWLTFTDMLELPNSLSNHDMIWRAENGYKSALDASPFFLMKSYKHDNIGSRKVMPSAESELWQKPDSSGFHQCVDHPKFYKRPKATPNGYIMVNANGGLNQMRDGFNVDTFDLTANNLRSVTREVDEEEEMLFAEIYRELVAADTRNTRRHGRGQGVRVGRGKGLIVRGASTSTRGGVQTYMRRGSSSSTPIPFDDTPLPLPREPSFDDDGNLISEEEHEASSSDDEGSSSNSLDEHSDSHHDGDDSDSSSSYSSS